MTTNEPKPWRLANDYLDSLLILDRSDATKADQFHGAFIPAVAESFLLRLTKPGSWTWDPFAGAGTTGRAAAGLPDRRVCMTDLNPTSPTIGKADAMHATIAATGGYDTLPMIILNDPTYSGAVIPFQFDLIILHPPYCDIIVFSDTPGDLSALTETSDFVAAFGLVVANAYRHLKPGGFMALVMGDIWQTGAAEWVPLGFYCMTEVLKNGPDMSLRAVQIKDIKGNRQDNRRNLRRARCFNAGTVEFRHEYLFTFKRSK